MAVVAASPPPSRESDDRETRYVFVTSDGISSDFCCSDCQRILDYPIQSSCGKRLCLSCYELFFLSGEKSCSCENHDKCSWTDCHPDAYARKQLLKYKFKCAEETCEWVGYRTDINKHLESLHDQWYCHGGCCSIMLKVLASRHSHSCPISKVTCRGCGAEIKQMELKLHLKDCLASRFVDGERAVSADTTGPGPPTMEASSSRRADYEEESNEVLSDSYKVSHLSSRVNSIRDAFDELNANAREEYEKVFKTVREVRDKSIAQLKGLESRSQSALARLDELEVVGRESLGKS